MVGSAQGWREATYLEVPASLDRLASALTPVDTASGATLHIVPGLIERGALPNVMRGEETQIAGALLTPAEVEEVRAAGGEFVVMPHTDVRVIRAARAAGLEVAPGAATPTEALAALGAGADVLKMFPAEQLGAASLAAWRAVLPPGTLVIAVGGITPATLPAFVAAGASGFGLGSALYRPGLSEAEVTARAEGFLDALRRAECDQEH